MSGRRARKWLMAGIKMEGNTEMDKVLLGRTSEFQVFFMMAMALMVLMWNVDGVKMNKALLDRIREAILSEKCSFFNIVQKAFDPAPFRLNIMW